MNAKQKKVVKLVESMVRKALNESIFNKKMRKFGKSTGLSDAEIDEYEAYLINLPISKLRQHQSAVQQQQQKLRSTIKDFNNIDPKTEKIMKQLEFRENALFLAVDYVAFKK